MDSCNHYWI